MSLREWDQTVRWRVFPTQNSEVVLFELDFSTMVLSSSCGGTPRRETYPKTKSNTYHGGSNAGGPYPGPTYPGATDAGATDGGATYPGATDADVIDLTNGRGTNGGVTSGGVTNNRGTVEHQDGVPNDTDNVPGVHVERNTYHVSHPLKERGSSDESKVVQETIEKLFPQLSQCKEPLSKKQLRDISTLVLGCMKLKNTFPYCGDMADTKDRARMICQQIFDHYPERAFFHLLSRWSRRRKFHFINDAVSTLLVLNSHFRCQQLAAFLLRSRDFRILPPSKKRTKLRVLYVAVGDESIVRKIDREILLTYCSVSTTHNIFLSRVRMDSVRRKQVFSVDVEQKKNLLRSNGEPWVNLEWLNVQQSNRAQEVKQLNVQPAVKHSNVKQSNVQLAVKCPDVKQSNGAPSVKQSIVQQSNGAHTVNQSNVQPSNGAPELQPTNTVSNCDKGKESRDDDDQSVDLSSPESTTFVLDTAPQLGYHLPTSFAKRIWSNILSLRLGFELYRILFHDIIVERKLYKQQLKNQMHDRTLQFLLLSTEEQDT